MPPIYSLVKNEIKENNILYYKVAVLNNGEKIALSHPGDGLVSKFTMPNLDKIIYMYLVYNKQDDKFEYFECENISNIQLPDNFTHIGKAEDFGWSVYSIMIC